MRGLINISAVSNGGADFIKSIDSYWSRQFDDAVPEFSKPQVSYNEAGTPVVPWDQASQIMLQQLSVMKKVLGG
jgi:hypothetical protein